MKGGYEGPRVARAGETRQILKFLSRIFSDGCPAGMEREYPHLYRNMEGNLDYCHVITFRGRIAAHVGIYPLQFVVDGRRVLAGGIGAVCTAEVHRGKGLMSELLEYATVWMRNRGMALSILWGDAVRYGRFGWTVAGTQARVSLSRRAIPALAEFRGRVLRSDGGGAELDELYKLHQNLRYRVARSREQFGLIMKKIGRRIYVARRAGRATAYCLVQSGGEYDRWGGQRHPAYSIEEWAGSGDGVMSILDFLLRSLPWVRIDMTMPVARLGWWANLLKGIDSWRLDLCALGQIKIIDRDRVLRDLGIMKAAPFLKRSSPAGQRDLAPLLFGPLPPSVHFPRGIAHKLCHILPAPIFLFNSDHV